MQIGAPYATPYNFFGRAGDHNPLHISITKLRTDTRQEAAPYIVLTFKTGLHKQKAPVLVFGGHVLRQWGRKLLCACCRHPRRRQMRTTIGRFPSASRVVRRIDFGRHVHLPRIQPPQQHIRNNATHWRVQPQHEDERHLLAAPSTTRESEP